MLKSLQGLIKPLVPRPVLEWHRRRLKEGLQRERFRIDQRISHLTTATNEKVRSRLEYEAAPQVRQVLANFGRTEDICFSPGDRRLALAGYVTNRILVLSVRVVPAGDTYKVLIEDYQMLSSESMRNPHGVSFINEDTVIVANRGGGVSIFRLPPANTGEREFDLVPVRRIRRNLLRMRFTPGSVDLYNDNAGTYKALVCNNYAHVVTSYSLEPGEHFRVGYEGVLLERGLEIPDGISVSGDHRWIAISNHADGTVRIYENVPELNRRSDTTGILRGMGCPHGIRFTADDRYLIVADAATPWVHIFESGDGDWGAPEIQLLQ